MNKENGDIHVYAQREVVEVVENPELQISLSDAKEVSKKYEYNIIMLTI